MSAETLQAIGGTSLLILAMAVIIYMIFISIEYFASRRKIDLIYNYKYIIDGMQKQIYDLYNAYSEANKLNSQSISDILAADPDLQLKVDKYKEQLAKQQ